MSKEVADRFVEALWKLEEDRDVEALKWTTSSEANGKDSRFRAYFDPRTLGIRYQPLGGRRSFFAPAQPL